MHARLAHKAQLGTNSKPELSPILSCIKDVFRLVINATQWSSSQWQLLSIAKQHRLDQYHYLSGELADHHEHNPKGRIMLDKSHQTDLLCVASSVEVKNET